MKKAQVIHIPILAQKKFKTVPLESKMIVAVSQWEGHLEFLSSLTRNLVEVVRFAQLILGLLKIQRSWNTPLTSYEYDINRIHLPKKKIVSGRFRP